MDIGCPPIRNTTIDEKMNVIGYGVEALFNILPDGAFVPFVAVGVGGIHYSVNRMVRLITEYRDKITGR